MRVQCHHVANQKLDAVIISDQQHIPAHAANIFFAAQDKIRFTAMGRHAPRTWRSEAGDFTNPRNLRHEFAALEFSDHKRANVVGQFFKIINPRQFAAIAATWALGLAWKTIVNGLASFVGDANTVPGRFNVFNYRGATLIADYGHNPDAIQALTQAVSGMPANRRSVVISGAGDRRDEDIRRQTQILGDAFDQVILYQDQCQRGRADGEVLGLLREGLVNARRAKDIQEIRGEFVAIDTALADISPGDLCLILVDQVEAALAHIAQRVGQG